MLRITSSGKIQVVLGGNVTANQLHCYATWKDYTDTTCVEGNNPIPTNNTTDIDLVPSPVSGTIREIDFISIYNKDTSNQTVTLKIDVGGTETILTSVVLGTLERLEYNDKSGIVSYTSSGAIKQSQFAGTSNPALNTLNLVVLGTDVFNNNATLNTLETVTGLSFPVIAGQTYYFEFTVNYTAAATTTGSRWGLNGPSIGRLDYTSEYTLTATTKTINNLGAYNLPAASNATSLAVGNIATIWGFITPSANGTVQLMFASEVGGSAITAKAGSILRWVRTL